MSASNQSPLINLQFYRPKPTFPPYSQLLDLLGVDERTDAQSRVRDLRKIPMTKLRDTTAQVFYPDMWGITYDPSEQGWKSSVWSQLEKGQLFRDLIVINLALIVL